MIDSKPVDEYEAAALLTVVDTITLRFALDHPGKPTERPVRGCVRVGGRR